MRIDLKIAEYLIATTITSFDSYITIAQSKAGFIPNRAQYRELCIFQELSEARKKERRPNYDLEKVVIFLL